MAIRRYTQKQIDKVLAAAVKFIEGSIAGDSSVTVGKVTHDPRETGMCAKFVRECYEAGLGLEEKTWAYRGDDANMMASKLRAAGYSIGDTGKLKPGDIVWKPAGRFGHIAIYLGEHVPGHDGKQLIGENTSSGKRGYPRKAGTKYTRRGAGPDEFGTWREVFRMGP